MSKWASVLFEVFHLNAMRRYPFFTVCMVKLLNMMRFNRFLYFALPLLLADNLKIKLSACSHMIHETRILFLYNL